MKTYISGPMTGYPQYNYPYFERTAKSLRGMGWEIISPHEIAPSSKELKDEELWQYYMAACKKQVEECERIIMCDGWPESKGARQELAWAIEQGKPVYFYSELESRVFRMSGDTQ